VLAAAHELRDAGFGVEYGFGDQAIGKQLKLADARGARAAVVIGPDDLKAGTVMLKHLGAKTQRSVAREALVAELTAELAAAADTTPTPVPAHG
jgi:histidyl-tRNA synthetase